MSSSRRSLAAVLLSLVALAACETDPTGPPSYVPQDLELRYEWELLGWDGIEPAGEPVVRLQWPVPSHWGGEAFNVYGKRTTHANYTLIGTVTACSPIRCRYDDSDVHHGVSYDYYVAAVNPRTGAESPSSARRVAIPARPPATAPGGTEARALDRAVYLRWQAVNDPNLWKYLVFLVRLNEASELYQVGETDGTGFVDLQVLNGVSYGYRVAAVDTFGHVSRMSDLMAASPRPGGTGVVVIAAQDDASRSGFSFPALSGEDPVVPAGSAASRWRLEAGADSWTLHPEGGAAVGAGVATTALSCGPGEPPGCTAMRVAPADGYETGARQLQPGSTYPLRYTLSGQTHHAKVRIVHLGQDAAGQRLAVVEWAHQLRPGDRTLSVGD